MTLIAVQWRPPYRPHPPIPVKIGGRLIFNQKSKRLYLLKYKGSH